MSKPLDMTRFMQDFLPRCHVATLPRCHVATLPIDTKAFEKVAKN